MPIILEIKVKPSSKNFKIYINKAGQICINLKSQPEKNKANIELLKLLSEKLEINYNDIHIITGLSSRIKRIKIDTKLNNLTKEKVFSKLNINNLILK